MNRFETRLRSVAECTALDPVSAAGYESWRWTVRRLREVLVPYGWEAIDEHGLPLVLNVVPDEGPPIAISVSTGDAWTGNRDRNPSTKYSKGPITASLVAINEEQLRLEFAGRPDLRAVPDEGERLTWILLVHWTPTTAQVELSLPASINPAGFVTVWRERVILGDIDLEDSIEILPEYQPEGSFLVNVTRRGAAG